MAGRPRSLRRKAYYARKMKRAVHLVFYRRHRQPGVKGWELRRSLGSDFPRVLNLLDDYLEKIDLTVKPVFEDEANPPESPTSDQLDRARFYVTLRGSLAPGETKLVGWRIDDLAGLAVSLGYIISKGWRVDLNINRYLRSGYLVEDENAQLYLDWRTRAEVDQKKLIDLFLETG